MARRSSRLKDMDIPSPTGGGIEEVLNNLMIANNEYEVVYESDSGDWTVINIIAHIGSILDRINMDLGSAKDTIESGVDYLPTVGNLRNAVRTGLINSLGRGRRPIPTGPLDTYFKWVVNHRRR